MNADFEMELSANSPYYRLPPAFEPVNLRLAEKLLWLTSPGDALLVDAPSLGRLQQSANERRVTLVRKDSRADHPFQTFSPWGWTPTSERLGKSLGAVVRHPDLEIVRRVNSKLWSFSLECELGTAIEGSAVAQTFEELAQAVAQACTRAGDKWVVKSPYGFAARDRVLGRGPVIGFPQAQWARRRFDRGEALLFQPWLEVKREYGIVMEIGENGSANILGISDLQTNGAGTGTGYILGRPVEAQRLRKLERVASIVADRLFEAGYYGPAGVDALEHSGGLLPLLEVNARYTMGFIALAVERELKPIAPVFWSIK